MSERTPQTKAALRVFGYDPEGPTEAPKPAGVQPVWTEQEVQDWIKNMSGPWFIPPCFVQKTPPPEVIAKTRDFPAMTWADALNAAYAHLNGGAK